jgi:aryl-alcohol dehydrogenase-like predicted oxidoreductase/histidinol phosphatase-like enzyme
MEPAATIELGMGCMRLSTEPDRDEARGIAVLHAAFAAGITFFDTADAYCWSDHEIGHNERLIARALDTWNGDRSRIQVATKGGLTRPDGRWAADGRARHLVAACQASRRALGVDRIALYQLHAPDPRTPLSTSVRALAALKRDGLIERIGLCNVNLGQIEAARRIADIAAVQVELSVWKDDSLLNGVAAYCDEHRIQLIAYRPVGGPARRRRALTDPALVAVAARQDATPLEIALAWLRHLSPLILPIPGATRVETVHSIVRARDIVLSEDDRARLDALSTAAASFRSRGQGLHRSAPPATAGDVLMIMGLPGAGKSTAAAALVEQGYERLNRDEAGGLLPDLLPALDRVLASGAPRVVLDNTYVSRKARAQVIEAARKHGRAVRCLWLSTTVDEAQVNAVQRMIARYGRLLPPEEMRTTVKLDVSAFGPTVQFRYQRELEPPEISEGFSQIEVVPFERMRDPSFTNRAVVVWCDGILWRSRSGQRAPVSSEDVELIAGRREALQRYAASGWRILGLSWQPEIAEEKLTADCVDGAIARLQDLLGLPIEVLYCPHGGGPPACWCRKPLPGLGVVLIERHRLDPSQCLYIGAGAQDPGFARQLGFQYSEAADFFASAD